MKKKQYSQTPADSKICLVKTNKVKVLLARKLCNRKKNNYNQIPADSKEFLEKNENKVKVLLAPKPISVKKAIHYSQTPASWSIIYCKTKP